VGHGRLRSIGKSVYPKTKKEGHFIDDAQGNECIKKCGANVSRASEIKKLTIQ